jgi:peptidoglycan/LPS O-acetylase OafA/YrhL
VKYRDIGQMAPSLTHLARPKLTDLLGDSLNAKPVPSAYMPQLDGLRTFAVLAVWFTHWGIGDLSFFRWIPWGDLGVQLFFVLSGFLITRILLDSKSKIAQSTVGFWPALGHFMARRSLRIFPIYYLLLATVSLIGITQILEALPWHLTYTSNFYFAWRGRLDVAGAHLWTLSVEEQFYFFWPLLILCTPVRLLGASICLTILAGNVYRLACWLANCHGLEAYVLLPACMDYFGWGALLAILGFLKMDRLKAKLIHVGILTGLPVLVALLIFDFLGFNTTAGRLSLPVVVGMVFSCVVGRAAVGFGGPLGWTLEARPIVYLGKISYGLYLFHGFVPVVILALDRRLGNTLPENVWLRFSLFSAVTIVISAVSWVLIEKPIARLKSFFQESSLQKSVTPEFVKV